VERVKRVELAYTTLTRGGYRDADADATVAEEGIGW